MKDKIERIARAICEADGELPEEVDPLDVSGKQREMWRRYVPHASAAIEALKGETSPIVKSGKSA